MSTTDAHKLLRKAERAHQASRFEEAAQLYRTAARYLSGTEKLEAQLHAAHCLRMVGKYRMAIAYYRRIAASDGELAIDALVGQAMAHRAIGELDSAEALFAEALRYYEHSGDLEGQAYVLWGLGGVLRFRGEFNRALSLLRKALRMYQQLELAEAEAYVRCALGGLHRMRGEYDDSLRFYTAARALLDDVGDRFGRAYAACGIANAYRMQKCWEDSLRWFAEAQHLYHAIGDRVSYAYTLWGEATLWKVRGELERAEELFRRAAALFRQTRDDRGLSYAYAGIGEVQFLRGNPKRALQYIRRAQNRAAAHGYRFELLHAQLLEALMTGADITPLRTAYRELGSRWLPKNVELPVNFP